MYLWGLIRTSMPGGSFQGKRGCRVELPTDRRLFREGTWDMEVSSRSPAAPLNVPADLPLILGL